MKHFAFLLLLLTLPVSSSDASDVKLELLENFDPKVHKVGVSIHVGIAGRCSVDIKNLEKAFEVYLTLSGFQTAPYKESQLEFAVSIKGVRGSESKPCGVMVTSRVRQIPNRKILRLPPESSSTRYQLWAVENVITSTPDLIQSVLHDQAREHVSGFYLAFQNSGSKAP